MNNEDFNFEYLKGSGNKNWADSRLYTIQLTNNSGIYNLIGNVDIKLSFIQFTPVIIHSYISAN